MFFDLSTDLPTDSKNMSVNLHTTDSPTNFEYFGRICPVDNFDFFIV